MIIICELYIKDEEVYPTEIIEDIKNMITDYLVKNKVICDLDVYLEPD